MAHRSSAAALTAARSILKNFTLVVRPPETLVSGRVSNLQANEACLAVIIDYATNVFHIVGLRPEVRYWQERLSNGTATAPQLVSFLQKIIEAYALLPKGCEERRVVTTLSTPKEFGRTRPEQIALSKPSLEVARFVYHYFEVTPKHGTSDPAIDHIHVAKLAETSLNIRRTMEVPEIAKQCKAGLLRGELTLVDIQRSFRALGVLLEYFPNYEEREEELKLL